MVNTEAMKAAQGVLEIIKKRRIENKNKFKSGEEFREFFDGMFIDAMYSACKKLKPEEK